MARINKALLAAGVLLNKPGLTEAELVKSATDSLSDQVDTLQVTINAESAIVASAKGVRDAEIQRLQGEFEKKTQVPNAKIAGAKLDSESLEKVYNLLTR